jgi:hypothetical protein
MFEPFDTQNVWSHRWHSIKNQRKRLCQHLEKFTVVFLCASWGKKWQHGRGWQRFVKMLFALKVKHESKWLIFWYVQNVCQYLWKSFKISTLLQRKLFDWVSAEPWMDGSGEFSCYKTWMFVWILNREKLNLLSNFIESNIEDTSSESI